MRGSRILTLLEKIAYLLKEHDFGGRGGGGGFSVFRLLSQGFFEVSKLAYELNGQENTESNDNKVYNGLTKKPILDLRISQSDVKIGEINAGGDAPEDGANNIRDEGVDYFGKGIAYNDGHGKIHDVATHGKLFKFSEEFARLGGGRFGRFQNFTHNKKGVNKLKRD